MAIARRRTRVLSLLVVATLAAIVFAPHSGAQDIAAQPHGDLSLECDACHTVDAWSPLRDPLPFDHDETGFALAAAHAEAVCRSCHGTLVFSQASADCVACHDADLRDATPPHEGFPTTCEDCHSVNGWAPANFDHNQTGFLLRGAHQGVDCFSCHADGYAGTPADCFSCHESDYNGASEPSHEGFVTTCEDCHTVSGWSPANFDHNQTGFLLRGAHQGVDCFSCHADGYAGT
ncbi:MAG: hypothetical protein GY715_20475, partial [Planctomycetes bacterium]|nr:hypothetical protein [Planctomycetota bacterium]